MVNYLRMDDDTYLNLPFIKKKDTIVRQVTSSHEILSALLRFLADVRRKEDQKFSKMISQDLGYIIPETCNAIYKVFPKDYLKVREKL